MTDTDLLGPGSGDEPRRDTLDAMSREAHEHSPGGDGYAPEPDDREALVEAIQTGVDGCIDHETEQAIADAIIAAGFRRHPEPVKPSREGVAEALYEASRVPGDSAAWQGLWADELRKPWLRWADAALALLPGRSAAEVQAEALREAARAVENDERDGSPSVRELVGTITSALNVEAWLLARADRIETERTNR